MTANFGFVADATKGNAMKFPTKGRGDGLRETCFTGSWGSNEEKNWRAISILNFGNEIFDLIIWRGWSLICGRGVRCGQDCPGFGLGGLRSQCELFLFVDGSFEFEDSKVFEETFLDCLET